MQNTSIEQLLGGKDVLGYAVKTEMDLYELSRRGLPKKALVHLLKNLNVTLKAMAALIHITERTLQRKSENDILDAVTSEQIIQIAQVYSRGTEVFGAHDRFSQWLETENTAFENKRPLELLASRYGAHMVLDELGRLEYGIIA